MTSSTAAYDRSATWQQPLMVVDDDTEIREVIGAVSLGDTSIRIVPKISVRHFNYLMCRSSVAPRR